MRNPGPFSGEPGENVNLYVTQCKSAWQAVTDMLAEDRAQVQAMTLLAGLRGPALAFAHTLPQEIQDNFEEFSQRLIEQFPFVGVRWSTS
ncbi:uncharacterized protein N7479_002251 [Penicillium vulpinum]|uniref:uncharacterized protein n=1 Tax=Penicillium vulpinum TaxID=29845 RepID=UPI0025499A25|nr:uncharacterized protein N7479_002251 [Penicillium vulpinum]KAJ5972333.1 hypothetical protein N7479_002251 [Penicillium vulpinum]